MGLYLGAVSWVSVLRRLTAPSKISGRNLPVENLRAPPKITISVGSGFILRWIAQRHRSGALDSPVQLPVHLIGEGPPQTASSSTYSSSTCSISNCSNSNWRGTVGLQSG